MNAHEKNIAVTRGEALAARLLAAAAIQAFFMLIPAESRDKALAGMSAFIEDTLNMSGPSKGDAHDEFNTQLRETARHHTILQLDEIGQLIRTLRSRE